MSGDAASSLRARNRLNPAVCRALRQGSAARGAGGSTRARTVDARSVQLQMVPAAGRGGGGRGGGGGSSEEEGESESDEWEEGGTDEDEEEEEEKPYKKVRGAVLLLLHASYRLSMGLAWAWSQAAAAPGTVLCCYRHVLCCYLSPGALCC